MGYRLPSRVSAVTVPCYPVHGLSTSRIGEDRFGVFWEVPIVVPNEYLSVDSVSHELRLQIIDHEPFLLLSSHQRARVIARLLHGLVLRGDRKDIDALLFVGQYKFNDVHSVRQVIFLHHLAAVKAIGGLHPGGRTPNGRNNLYCWVYLQDFLQHWNDVLIVVFNREKL